MANTDRMYPTNSRLRKSESLTWLASFDNIRPPAPISYLKTVYFAGFEEASSTQFVL
jgi:hypothetical protein